MDHQYDYLIVGGGMTADAAVKAIRDLDDTSTLGVIGAEADGPYERPPLTKGLWNDADADVSGIDLGTATKGADVHTGREVVKLEPDAHQATDNQGDTWQYGRLLWATGASPRRFGLPQHDRILFYRTKADYKALRGLAGSGTHVAVIGSGFIGSEVAAAMINAGCKVTMVFPEDDIGAGRFPDGLADFVTDYYLDKGVTMIKGVTVKQAAPDDTGVTLQLSDGSDLRADVVVAGLGVTPNVALAEQAGLDVDNGIIVDAQLKTSAPDIWAAGDVANFYNPALGQRLRVEHENAAIGMGAVAGRNMTGDSASYDTLPFFYSDLFDLGYEAVGLLDNNRLDVFEDWKVPNREGVIYYLDDSRVRGVLLWNTWGQVEAARDLIAQPGPIDMESLRGRIPRAV